ncbi:MULTISPECIES: hypothetical protein [unclassified Streptomyces]|uniref:hypothetical protein n=1 Tax=unclassified Streptomyces TaxID=2593676 RepID=UPI002258BBB9|nr:hypothetical protein [Streptomyces sp. NBC_01264]MCX4784058.1 hypothetical protein [Streptomyces sp. NBC_01264]
MTSTPRSGSRTTTATCRTTTRPRLTADGTAEAASQSDAPHTGQAATDPDSLVRELADLRGRFEDGYTAEDVRAVFGRISDAGGPYLVCLWDYADEFGFGGNSEFFAEDDAGNFFEVTPDIHRWLSGEQEVPGAVSTWVCSPVTKPFTFAVSDDFHNYARSGS